MVKRVLHLIDLEHLVSRLNSIRSNSEEQIVLGEFKETMGTPSFPGISGRQANTFGEYDLVQQVQGVGMTKETHYLGRVSIESGNVVEASSPYGEIYEKIQLKLWRPIKIRNGLASKSGLTIPRCSVKLSVESGGFSRTSPVYRKDQLKFFWIFGWDKTDLSRVLPNNWFVKDYQQAPKQEVYQ